ncbi:hypothetical protein C8F01DRAFT_1165805 [Mycena amicta]|nr:hypothetical protein C8F01DRAFT_1165805 [Mycena amicta]
MFLPTRDGHLDVADALLFKLHLCISSQKHHRWTLRRPFSTAMQTKVPLHAMPAGNLPDACAETHGRSRYQRRAFFSFAHCCIPSHIYSAQQSPVDTALPPRVFCGAACTSSLHRHESYCPTFRLWKIYERVCTLVLLPGCWSSLGGSNRPGRH